MEGRIYLSNSLFRSYFIIISFRIFVVDEKSAFFKCKIPYLWNEVIV